MSEVSLMRFMDRIRLLLTLGIVAAATEGCSRDNEGRDPKSERDAQAHVPNDGPKASTPPESTPSATSPEISPDESEMALALGSDDSDGENETSSEEIATGVEHEDLMNGGNTGSTPTTASGTPSPRMTH